MSDRPSFFDPSDRALAFGAQYADVLAHWARLFDAASTLVQANVTLGQMASDSAKEFEQWLRLSAMAPWNWMSPEALQQAMASFTATPPGQA